MISRQEPARLGCQLIDLAQNIPLILRWQVFFRKINIGLHVSQDIDQQRNKLLHLPTQRPAQLLIRCGQGSLTPRMDEVHHRLRLA